MTGPIDTALAALDAGISTVPPTGPNDYSRDPKAPMRSWERWQGELPSADQIRTWYANGQTGVGFVGGRVSGGLELFEFEGRAVEGGIAERFTERADAEGLGDLVRQLCTGYWSRSPSGGWHWLYRCEVTGCVKLAKTAPDAEGGRKDLIETKGEGGYMVEWPTPGYEVLGGGLETIPTISADQRRRLFALAAEFDQRTNVAEIEEEDDRSDDGFKRVDTGWMAGVVADFNARTDWADVLAGRFEHLRDRAGVGYWHYIGQSGWQGATTNATGTDRLIVFSGTAGGQGWRIHEPPRRAPSYDRFSAYVFIETGSHDTRVEVARRLREEGYGPAPQPPNGDAAESRGNQATRPAALVLRAPLLPDEFWSARPSLAHIRRAAHARMLSADAVLHVVLARVAAITPHTLVIPPIRASAKPLSYFAALVAGPEAGKSGAGDTGSDLVPAPDHVADQLPIGSGEGLADVLFDLVEEPGENGRKVKVKRQVRHNAYVVIDEGQTLAEIGNRQGATVLPALRTIWSGGVLGQANAAIERRRIVPAGSYVFGLIAGFQPQVAGRLIDDAPAGTPQRFAWAWATDSLIPDELPPWPGPLDWTLPPRITGGQELVLAPEIITEVQAHGRAVATGAVEVPLLDAHGLLLRLKIAGLLAVLDGRMDINVEDWALAGVAKATSDRVRDRVVDIAAVAARDKEAATQARTVRTAVATEEAKDRRKGVQEVAERIVEKISEHPGELSRSELRKALSRPQRRYFDDALALVMDEGSVIEREATGQGSTKKRLWLDDGNE